MGDSEEVRCALRLFEEALDSFKTLIGCVGNETKANILFLKWPDAILSYLREDGNYEEDIAILICAPIKSIIEGLIIYNNEHGGNDKTIKDEVIAIMKTAKNDPVAAKKGLIKICNRVIVSLKSRGLNPCEEIGDSHG